MGILIDSSILVAIERAGNDFGLLRERLGEDEFSISVITVSEMLAGVAQSTPTFRPRRQAFVEGIIGALTPLPVTTEVARIRAELQAQLRAAGTPIGVHDLWIAATAIANDLSVATGNAHESRRVPGLTVIDALGDA